MKKYYVLLCLFFFTSLMAQVGINTTTPNAQLDIQSSNQVTPANTDGLLIPKVDTFPTTNPTAAQQGMMVYLTSTVGSNPPGFYYWDNPTTTWINIKGSDGGTLDQAYDFGGAGNGRTITSDTGAVLIDGTDGLVSTGTIGSGVIAPSGAGTRMVWNPRKAAFRAGSVSGTQWDDAGIGQNSTAFGNGTIASGQNSFAFGDLAEATGNSSTSFGFQNLATGNYSTAFGGGNAASGELSVAFGNGAVASGIRSTAFGTSNTASGFNSTAFGQGNQARSYSETVLGIGATTYTPSTNGATQFRTANATDRLFVIGNAIDANNNSTVDTAERSDAMVVLKNGSTGFGTSTPNALLDVASNNKGVMVPRVSLTSANVASPITNPNGGALPESTLVYNTVTAGTGANEVTPGFHYWNGTKWIKLEENNGKTKYYSTIGTFGASVGGFKTLMPQMQITFTPKSSVVLVNFSASGNNTSPATFSDFQSVIFFDLLLNGSLVKGFQTSEVNTDESVSRTTWDTNIYYPISVTPYVTQTISINWASSTNVASNILTPIAIPSSSLTLNSHRVLSIIDPEGGGGIVTPITPPVTNQFWSINGNSGTSSLTNFIGTLDNQDVVFKRNNTISGRIAANNTSLGVSSLINLTSGSNNVAIGNSTLAGLSGGSNNTAIGSFANITSSLVNSTAIGSRASVGTDNSLVLGSVNGVNGATATVNVGIGTTTPQERLHISGKSLFENGFSVDNAALLYKNDSDYMFIGPQSGSSSNGGAIALFGSTNASSGNAGGMDLNVPNGSVRMFHTNGNYTFRTNSTSGYTGLFELNDIGFVFGHNSASRAILFSPGSVERMRLTPGGFLGIGTNAPARKLHVSNGVSGGTSNGNTGILLESNGNVYQHFLTPSASENGFLFGSELASINGGIIFNNSTNTNGFQFRAGGNSTRMVLTDIGRVGIGLTNPGGQFELSLNEGRKPTSNTWIIPSDARLKNVNGIYQKGLSEIMQLKPIRYNYKNTDKKTFEQKVLDKEAYGFLAQEVQPLFPEAVGKDADGYLNFDLHPIMIASINAFKELNSKYEELKNKNNDLEAKLNLLLSRIETLEKK